MASSCAASRSALGRQPSALRSTKPVACRCSRVPATAAAHKEDRFQVVKDVVKKVAIGAAGAALSVSLALGSVPTAEAVTTEQLLFLEAWRAVDRAYVDKDFNGQSWFRVRETFLKKESYKTREETYAAIRKLLASLDDPFTRFLTPDKYASLRRGTSGSVTGVGLELAFDDSVAGEPELVVVAPASGGPAEAAGIKPRDAVLAVDGFPTTGLGLYEVAEKLQGEEGSSVTLAVRPVGARAVQDITVERRKVTIVPVSYNLCTDVSPSVGPGAGGSTVGIIRVSTFNKNTSAAVYDAIDELEKRGVDRYVLDIRRNGGGLFPAGVQVAKDFINRGELVFITDSAGIRDIYESDGTAVVPNKPLSVLVDRGTASASEVLAGALKDNKRATIVGERTFGKGLIQTVVQLSDGSAVAVTVAQYQTPGGIDINKKGITPTLEMSPDVLPQKAGDFCPVLTSPEAPQLYK